VSGTETLHYHRSSAGSTLAAIVQPKLVEALELPGRGVKARRAADCGGLLLQKTDAPCVIGEPFFIDKAGGLKRATERFTDLADAYVQAIEAYAETLDNAGTGRGPGPDDVEILREHIRAPMADDIEHFHVDQGQIIHYGSGGREALAGVSW
jgi:hypothetical protein